MSARILLITLNDGFGELLRQALIDHGGHEVLLVESGVKALQKAQSARFVMTILDCQVDDVPPGEIANALLEWQPEMRFIAVPPDNNPAHLRLSGFSPHAFLTKPFYMPDMLKIVDKVLSGGRVNVEDLAVPAQAAEPDPPAEEPLPLESEAGTEPEPAFPWLSDLDIAAQHLARLSLESSAKAALIARGDQLFAYAGEFPQPRATELAETVGQQWNRRRGSDLAQFVKLDDGLEYMMYATHLVDDLVLALIFDAKMPFSKIRNQANRLAQALSSDQDGKTPGDAAPVGPAGRRSSTPELPDDWVTAEAEKDNPVGITDTQEILVQPARLELELQDLPVEADPEEALDWLPRQLTEDAARLLDDQSEEMPPFDIPSDWQPTKGDAGGARSFLEKLLEDPLPAAKFPYEEEIATPSSLEMTQPSWLPDPEEKPPRQPYFPSPDSMAETRPTPVPSHDHAQVQRLEPESASFFHATYACVLVPRLPQHHLVRDLAKMLEEWMPQICVSFDWRIEQLAIRPDYMQWMVRVHSATAPRYMMQIVAKITSDKIFFNLPRLADENPSGEFWAPGWLLISGDKMPPPKMVQEFIQNTRKRQGLD